MAITDQATTPTLTNMAEAPAQALAAWQAATVLPMTLAVETLRFAGRRALAQADHLAQLAQCQDLAAAVETQLSFAQATASAYRDEADVVAKQIQTAVSSTAVSTSAALSSSKGKA